GAGLPLVMPLLDGSTLVTAGATMTMPIYTSGMTRAGIDAARANLDAEQHGAAALAQQVKLAVAERYVGVLRAESAVAVADGNVASLAAHLRAVEDMYRGGSVPRNDFLPAAVSLADAEQRRLQAAHALDLARAAGRRVARGRAGPRRVDRARARRAQRGAAPQVRRRRRLFQGRGGRGGDAAAARPDRGLHADRQRVSEPRRLLGGRRRPAMER